MGKKEATGLPIDPIQVVPYRGFGNNRVIWLQGRVLDDSKIRESNEKDSSWRNLWNAWRRFESDEIPGARVRATISNLIREAVADSEGYFYFDLRPETPLVGDSLWHEVKVELLEPLLPGDRGIQETGYVMVPSQNARFGVISDMDDTVIQTDVTNFLRMIKNIVLTNARTRLPFQGVAAFYQALHQENGKPTNPLYYVSSSPWNLYDLLIEFFLLQKIPLGPLLLRDWGISQKALPQDHRSHKLDAIRRIMDAVHDLPFILIGDSGQQDPEIYYEVLSLYPKRVPAIYIRSVSRKPKRIAAIRELAKKVVDAGSTLILAENTMEAAKHAAEQGWINADALPSIVQEVQES